MKATVLYSGFSTEKAKLMNNLSDIIQKIHAFHELKQGWHFGEGHGPKRETIEMAEKIVQLLHEEFFCKVDTFPGIWGEIQVTAYPEDFFIEININPFIYSIPNTSISSLACREYSAFLIRYIHSVSPKKFS